MKVDKKFSLDMGERISFSIQGDSVIMGFSPDTYREYKKYFDTAMGAIRKASNSHHKSMICVFENYKELKEEGQGFLNLVDWRNK